MSFIYAIISMQWRCDMRATEDLKTYLRNSFIDDVFVKLKRPDIETTSKYVWGKDIKLPFYHDGAYNTSTFELENWCVTLDILKFNTIEELINAAVEGIANEEVLRFFEADPSAEYNNTMVCHQLCEWQVLLDEDSNPLQGNLLTLVKYAKFIDMKEYGIKEEGYMEPDISSLEDGLIVDEMPIITEGFSNPSLEEAYKQGIKDTLDWLTEPANRDTYSNEYGERIYYFVYESEINQFAKKKQHGGLSQDKTIDKITG